MKTYLVLAAVAVCSFAPAIENVTEAEVTQHLNAAKVIEISKVTGLKLVTVGGDCEMDLRSRSGRAYVVKKGKNSHLYTTEEDLDGLRECGALNKGF